MGEKILCLIQEFHSNLEIPVPKNLVGVTQRFFDNCNFLIVKRLCGVYLPCSPRLVGLSYYFFFNNL